MEKFLIDTNIFLEILLKQERKETCKEYLNERIGRLCISDFSLHSIGVILFRLNKHGEYESFLKDILPRIELLGLPVISYASVSKIATKYKLDFDDAFQTAVAKTHSLTISTIDRDYKKVEKDFKIDLIV